MLHRISGGITLLSILAFATLGGCSNFNRTDRERAIERLEQIQPTVSITGDSASYAADRAMERGRLWLRNFSTLKAIQVGADTIVSEPPALSEFGYRILRSSSAETTRIEVAQRVFGGYYSGYNSRLLAWYMATGAEFDSTLVLFRPSLTSYYFQLGGEGLFASLNLEHLLLPHFAARAGIGIWVTGLLSGAESGWLMPVTISWISNPNQGLEIGTGASFLLGKAYPIHQDDVLGLAFIGYRNVPIEGGMVIRVTFTPRYSFSAGRFVFETPLFGVAIGHTL